MTMTVMMIEAMTNTIVNNMYLPIRGTALEVEGISSTMTRRNTVKDSRTEMLRVIFSPAMQKKPKHKQKKNPATKKKTKPLLLLSFSTDYSQKYMCVHLERNHLSQHPKQ